MDIIVDILYTINDIGFVEKDEAIKYCMDTFGHTEIAISYNEFEMNWRIFNIGNDGDYAVKFSTESQLTQFKNHFNESTSPATGLFKKVLDELRPNLMIGEGTIIDFFSLAEQQTCDKVLNHLKKIKFDVSIIGNDLYIKWKVPDIDNN
jgi:hypothetical protein